MPVGAIDSTDHFPWCRTTDLSRALDASRSRTPVVDLADENRIIGVESSHRDVDRRGWHWSRRGAGDEADSGRQVKLAIGLRIIDAPHSAGRIIDVDRAVMPAIGVLAR